VLVVSLDFELYWGVRDRSDLASYAVNLRGAREVVKRLVELFVESDVHATWATVGALFCKNYDELQFCLPARRPSYRNAALSPYYDLPRSHTCERDEPLRYAGSLVDLIKSAPGQEIATHTFSHYYCLEEGQTPEDFAADLDAAGRAAELRGVRLESIVFPRNQVNAAYLRLCRAAGLVAFRGGGEDWRDAPGGAVSLGRRLGRLVDAYLPLGPPTGRTVQLTSDGLVDVKASRFFRPRAQRLRGVESLKIQRLISELRTAGERSQIYHVWWHPHNMGADIQGHVAQVKRVLREFQLLNETLGMRSLSMADVAREVGVST
jgi:hypothetical protein